MELMKTIVNHIENSGPVITNTMMLSSGTMVDTEYF